MRLLEILGLGHFFAQRYQWYRRACGGRWERHLIDVCRSHIWLQMSANPMRQWPAYRQPCSVGVPLIEDWPTPSATQDSK
jgi:hypothetical protein